jgi:hypothetical protein
VSKTWLLTALPAALLIAGCKQDIGERCQVNSDCASGICSRSDPKVCQANGSNSDDTQIDAMLPIDAPALPPDAAVDAAVDAPVDSMVDAP